MKLTFPHTGSFILAHLFLDYIIKHRSRVFSTLMTQASLGIVESGEFGINHRFWVTYWRTFLQFTVPYCYGIP